MLFQSHVWLSDPSPFSSSPGLGSASNAIIKTYSNLLQYNTGVGGMWLMNLQIIILCLYALLSIIIIIHIYILWYFDYTMSA